jgi:2,5-diamino-6-(ribosylamino)-4(3H)-pyrimidinone 5'-phosphate reductase
MLPRVIQFNETSLDGRMDWFTSDMGLYYGLAARWQPDAMLSGSSTMLPAFASVEELPENEAAEPPELHPNHVPFLVIVDSRGQIRKWRRIKREPYWRNVVALCSRATPPDYLDYLQQCHVDWIVAGDDHVDLGAALEELNARYGIKVVRVDSGGQLNGVLFRAGLVDEVSVLINPCLVGGTSPRSIFVAPDLTSPEGVIPLKLLHVETLQDNAVWLRYEVVKS